jgi:hypothetical protein
MFAYFYQLCAAVFLLQGVSTPFLVLALGILWRKQTRRLEALGKELGPARGKDLKPDEVFESALERLPKLRPLSCAGCGGSVLLREAETFCPYCGARGDLPEDYAAAVSLRSKVRGLLDSAVRHWRVANVLASRPAGWAFFLLIFIEPLVLFPAVVIGSNVFPDTWLDSALGALGETAAFLVMLAAFFGFIVWMVVFIFLASLGRTLRAKLPAAPAPGRRARGGETSSCRACGGGVEYDAGDLVRLCAYCNVENFRARFARLERARAGRELSMTKETLFGAMEVIEDYVGTAFFVLTILVVASLLLTAYNAFRNLL